jgi:hypothetical protein
MKFLNGKRVVDYANELHTIKKRQRELREEFRTLRAQGEAIEEFLYRRSGGENFRFNGDDDYVKELDFVPRSREDIDDAAVRRIFARLNKKVPVKSSEWIEIKIRYVTEDEAEE